MANDIVSEYKAGLRLRWARLNGAAVQDDILPNALNFDEADCQNVLDVLQHLDAQAPDDPKESPPESPIDEEAESSSATADAPAEVDELTSAAAAAAAVEVVGATDVTDDAIEFEPVGEVGTEGLDQDDKETPMEGNQAV